MIVAQGLTKQYGDRLAVDNLDLHISRGELFGFLGPNGAGKTTTIRMLIGTLIPTSGVARIGGIDINQDPVEAKRLIGFVPDSPNIYEKLTAREFLEFVGSLRKMEPGVIDRRSNKLLDLFELENRADELLSSFSHGMKQKVCLAAALLSEPQVLFLDEPTVGLDPKSARLIKDILRNLCAKGTTVFMSTHILEIAERMCTRVGIIQQGKLLAVGTIDELRQLRHGDDKTSLEDLFLELTGGSEYAEVTKYLEE